VVFGSNIALHPSPMPLAWYISIATDAHSISGLDNMRFGVGQASRGWLEKGDVINTRTLKQLKKLLKRG
jgi:DNA polymerase (family X)